MMDRPATTPELMVVTLARELRNHEWGACGAYSQIPMAAFRLARMTHAPDLWWMAGGGGAMNSEAALVDSSSDYRTVTGAEHLFRLEDIVDFELGGWRRLPTMGIFGGIQVDRAGSVNMVGVRDADGDLRLRGPGTVGLVFGGYFSWTMIYLHRHDPLTLVDEVDYVSSPGHTQRRQDTCQPHSRGPQLVVTPIAVLDFGTRGLMRLRSTHRGHSVDEVRERTGFELEVSEGVGETPAPTETELRLIREAIDPHGVLDRLRIR